MDASNLPDWNGASAVYTRLQRLAQDMGAREYAAHHAKRKRRDPAFRVSADVQEICAAIGAGEEEQCKWLLRRHWANVTV